MTDSGRCQTPPARAGSVGDTLRTTAFCTRSSQPLQEPRPLAGRRRECSTRRSLAVHTRPPRPEETEATWAPPPRR